jgi:hypothetical protein
VEEGDIGDQGQMICSTGLNKIPGRRRGMRAENRTHFSPALRPVEILATRGGLFDFLIPVTSTDRLRSKETSFNAIIHLAAAVINSK